MRKVKKAVRKAAEKREKDAAKKAAPTKCATPPDAPKKSACVPPSMDTEIDPVVGDIMQGLKSEAQNVLANAAEFESQLISAARILNLRTKMEKHGFLAVAQDASRNEIPHKQKRLTLGGAIAIVVNNLQEEFPDLHKNLKEGVDARNHIIHDLWGVVDGAMPMMIALSPPLLPSVSVDKSHSLMRKTADVSADGIKKMSAAMAAPLQLSRDVHIAAFREWCATIAVKNQEMERAAGAG